jgi:hypothetical protein
MRRQGPAVQRGRGRRGRLGGANKKRKEKNSAMQCRRTMGVPPTSCVASSTMPGWRRVVAWEVGEVEAEADAARAARRCDGAVRQQHLLPAGV